MLSTPVAPGKSAPSAPPPPLSPPSIYAITTQILALLNTESSSPETRTIPSVSNTVPRSERDQRPDFRPCSFHLGVCAVHPHQEQEKAAMGARTSPSHTITCLTCNGAQMCCLRVCLRLAADVRAAMFILFWQYYGPYELAWQLVHELWNPDGEGDNALARCWSNIQPGYDHREYEQDQAVFPTRAYQRTSPVLVYAQR